MLGDINSIVASPVPLRDEAAVLSSNQYFASRQRILNKPPSSERGSLVGYANFSKPLSEAFSITSRGNKRSNISVTGYNNNPLALHVIQELKESEKNLSIYREEVQEKERIAGYWEKQRAIWAEEGKFKKQEVAEARKIIALSEADERTAWIIGEEMKNAELRYALRQFSLNESETGTRSASRHGSGELFGPQPSL